MAKISPGPPYYCIKNRLLKNPHFSEIIYKIRVFENPCIQIPVSHLGGTGKVFWERFNKGVRGNFVEVRKV